jgi:hypothetical protein
MWLYWINGVDVVSLMMALFLVTVFLCLSTGDCLSLFV